MYPGGDKIIQRFNLFRQVRRQRRPLKLEPAVRAEAIIDAAAIAAGRRKDQIPQPVAARCSARCSRRPCGLSTNVVTLGAGIIDLARQLFRLILIVAQLP